MEKRLLQCKPEDEPQKPLDWNQARLNRDTFIVISIQSIAQLATFTKNNPDVTFHFVLRHGPWVLKAGNKTNKSDVFQPHLNIKSLRSMATLSVHLLTQKHTHHTVHLCMRPVTPSNVPSSLLLC